MKKALFVTYGGGHVNMVIPVVRECRRGGAPEPIVLGLTTAPKNLTDARIPCVGYRDLVEPERDREAIEQGRRLAEQMGNSAVIETEETVAYLGLSFADLASRIGFQEAGLLYRQKGRHAFLQLGPMRRAVEKWRPQVVIATNSPRSEKAAILVAREMGIPSVCLVDLFGIQEMDDRLAKPGFADRVCVISESVRRELLSRGRGEQEVVVTGNPAFDRLHDPALHERAEKLRGMRGWGDLKIFLWIRSSNPVLDDVSRRTEHGARELLLKHPNWGLVIRPHPNETAYSESEAERVWISHRSEELGPLLQAVDAVGVMTSTVGMEAALLGRPVLHMEMAPIAWYAPYAKMGLAIGVRHWSELERALETAFRGEFRPAPLPPPGAAAGNVARVIRDLLGSTLASR